MHEVSGEFTTYEGDKVAKRIFVAGGFAEVSPAGCIVLAEEAVPVADIDAADARQRLKDAQEGLADARDASDAERAVADARVAVVSGSAAGHWVGNCA
jgi:F-type H+-transporting ATPase subunit epsilon